MIKAIALDIDNTLTDDVSWLRITELLGASVATHEDIFGRFSRHELSYEEAKRRLIELWQQTGRAHKPYWEALFADWQLTDGAVELVARLHEKGYATALITGSVDLFAEAIARRLHIAHWYANTTLVWNEEGVLTDFHYVRDQAAQKLLDLELFAAAVHVPIEQCVAIGDGPNDLELFRVTGHGIAVGADSPELREVAWKKVDTLSEVVRVLDAT